MDWFRMYGEFATDPKVQSMPEPMQRRLVMLLCLRCGNTLETLHETDIAFALRIDDAALAETKALFVRKNFINEDWELVNWERRQKRSDSSAERVRKHREKSKQLQKQDCNVTETVQIREEENRKEEKKEKQTPPASPPDDELFPGIDSQVVADFKAMRKTQKAKITKTAIDGIQREAVKAGFSLETALRTCCERGWRGFNAEWVKPQPNARGSPGAPWWSTDPLILAEGAKMNLRPHAGETMATFKGRVQAAIDNGGVPPAPKPSPTVVVRDDGRTSMPVGLKLTDYLKPRATT